MGRRRRDALGHGRLEGTRTGRLRRGAVQEEGMVALVLTAGRRWSRCRLDVGGGAASRFTVVLCSGPALPRSRSPPSPSGSSLPRPAPAATRRRRRASVSRLASSSPTPPFFFPLRRRLWEGAKTPMRVGGGGPLALALPLLLNPRRRMGRAIFRCCPPGLDHLAPVAAALAPSLCSRCHWDMAQG
jgi:hypothetical protein